MTICQHWPAWTACPAARAANASAEDPYASKEPKWRVPVLVGGVLFAITSTSLIAYLIAKHRRFRLADVLPTPMYKRNPTSNASQYGGTQADVSKHGASQDGVSWRATGSGWCAAGVLCGGGEGGREVPAPLMGVALGGLMAGAVFCARGAAVHPHPCAKVRGRQATITSVGHESSP